MELLQGFIQPPKAQSAEETIPTLCDRVENATLISDRRSAVLGLKAFSRGYRETVIATGLKPLINTLKRDSIDEDSVKAILETLLILFIRGEGNDDLTRNWISQHSRLQNSKYPSPLLMKQEHEPVDQFSLWIADALTQTNDVIHLFFQLMEFGNFHITLYTIQLLEAVIASRPARTREAVISLPTGISTLVSLLDDLHDPIRDEAILLLMALANESSHIQKLVAFENIFEKLFAIVEEEGGLRGSLVVSDCLSLIIDILKYNSSNQSLFLETGNLPQIAKILNEPLSDSEEFFWNDQRIINIRTALEIVKLTVEPGNTSTLQHQRALLDSHVLMIVLKLAFYRDTPNSVRPMALLTAADVIRDNAQVQAEFRKIDVPFFDPSLLLKQSTDSSIIMPVLEVLLSWSLYANSIHTFDIRVASCELLKASLNKNHELKRLFLKDQISQFKHLNEEAIEQSFLTPNIFSTMLEYDPELKLNPFKLFFTTDLLMYLFQTDESSELQDLARGMNSGSNSAGEESLSSIQTISELLLTSLSLEDPRVPISYLCFLIFWFFEDNNAVNDFLLCEAVIKSLLAFSSQIQEEDITVKCLITMLLGVAYEFSTKDSPLSRRNYYELLSKSIGQDNYSSRIKQFKEKSLFSQVRDQDDYLVNFKNDETGLPQTYFSVYFSKLFQENYYRIQTALRRGPDTEQSGKISFETLDELQKEATLLKERLKNSENSSTNKIDELDKQLHKLKDDQKTLENANGKYQSELTELNEKHDNLKKELEDSKQRLADINTEKDKLIKTKNEQEEKLMSLEGSLAENNMRIERLEKDLLLVSAEKKKAEDGINKMNRELFSLTKEKQILEEQVQRSKKEVEKLTDAQKKESQMLSDSLRQREEKINDLEILIRNHESKKEELIKESDSRSQQITDLQSRLKSQDDLISKLTEKLKSLVETYKAVEEDRVAISEKLEQHENSSKEKIVSLQRRLDELLTKNSAFTQEETQLNLKIENLEQKLQQKLQQYEENSERNEAFKKEVTELKSELERLKSLNVSYELQLEEKQKESDLSKTKLNELQVTLEKQEATNKERVSSILNQMETVNEERRVAADTILKLKKEVDVLNGEIRANEEAHKTVLSNLEKEIDVMKVKISELEKERAKLQEAYSASQSEKLQLTSTLSELRTAQDSNDAEYKNIQTALDLANKQNLEAQGKANNLQQETKTLQAEVQEKNDSIRNYKIELDGLEDDVKKEKDERVRLMECHSKELKRLNEEIQKLRGQLKQKALDFEQERKLLNEGSTTINQGYSEKVSLLEEKLEKNEGEYAFKLDALEKEKSSLEQRITDLETLNSSQIKTLASLENIQEATNHKLESKETLITETNEKHALIKKNLEEDIQRLKEEYLKSEQNTSSLEDKISQQAKSLTANEEEAEKLSLDLNEKQTELKDSLVQLESIKREFGNFKLTSEEKLKSLKEAVSRGEEKEIEALAKLKESDELLSSKEDVITDLNSRVKDLVTLKECFEESSLKIERLESKNGEYLKQLEEAHKDSEQMSEAINRISKENELLRNNLESCQHECKKLQETSTSQKESSGELKNLEAKLSELKEEVNKWKSKAEDRSEIDDLMLLVTDLDQKNNKYRNLLEQMGAEISSDDEDDGDDGDSDDDDSNTDDAV